MIDDIQHDYRKAEVLIRLKEPETEEPHILLFQGVVSLLWTMNRVEGEICQDVFPEFTSILLDKVSLFTKDKWLKSFPLHFNVCIEIMDRALLIFAEEVTLDEYHFKLK